MIEQMGKERPTDIPFFKIENVLYDAPILSSNEKLVLFKLMRHAYGENKNHAFPSKKTIALTTSLSYPTVQRALKSLEEKGYVFAELRKGEGEGGWQPTVYHWDKTKLLKECILSCLEHKIVQEKDLPEVWVTAVQVESKIKDITKDPIVTQIKGYSHTDQRVWSHRSKPIVTQINKEEEEKKTKIIKQEKKEGFPLLFSSSPVSDETEKPKISVTYKEKMEAKKLERILCHANKIKNQLESEGYRREDLDSWFDRDIENRKIDHGKGNRLHFLDITARSYQANLAKGIDEWQILITKFEEKYNKACEICGKEMKTETCLNCENKPVISQLKEERWLSCEEKEKQKKLKTFAHAQSEAKKWWFSFNQFEKEAKKNPTNNIAQEMTNTAKQKFQSWCEDLQKLCDSSNHYNTTLTTIRKEVEQELSLV